MGLTRLYLEIGALVALLAAGWWWSAHERTVGGDEVRAEMAAEANAQRIRGDRIADELETEKAKRKVVYATITKTVDKIVDRPVYRDHDCLDSDGVLLVNAALAGHAASEPASTLPASVAP